MLCLIVLVELSGHSSACAFQDLCGLYLLVLRSDVTKIRAQDLWHHSPPPDRLSYRTLVNYESKRCVGAMLLSVERRCYGHRASLVNNLVVARFVSLIRVVRQSV